jgi:2-polyprenyl-6-methoxyphenol hydroxylase-like FAD-dependent oxidoreductase
VGDACHKFTTHVGLGLNNGIQDVVMLCNSLRRAVLAAPSGDPDGPAIREVFEGYETVRKSSSSSLHADAMNSGLETRMHAWKIWPYYMLSRWLIVPKFVEDLMMAFVIIPQFRKGLVLDYVPTEEPMIGKLGWLHPMRAGEKGP